MLYCSCGGEYKNVDPIYPTGQRTAGGHVVYDQRRLYKGFATRQCNLCGKMRRQRLRVAKPKPPKRD